ncbi:MAG: hypothetical protein PHN82_05565 [bacterium]|nr:hypothetical protein [bacterium]
MRMAGAVAVLAGMVIAGGAPAEGDEARTTGRPCEPRCKLAYPTDPIADIEWSAGTSGVADIQKAFNDARAAENAQLGTAVPSLSMPSQAEWDARSDGQKALWLINREREDRGVAPLHGVESNVTGVAQNYADYLLANDAFDHNADGHNPWWRLDQNPAIGACRDSLNVAENLAVFVTSGTSIPLPVERSVYMWMYEDSGSAWGHRHCALWHPYTDNSGPAGREGFLGIGRASGGPYQGPFSQQWNFAELIVMNVFDPCASWVYAPEPGPGPTPVPGTNCINLAAGPPVVAPGGSVTLAFSALAGRYGFVGVPLDVYVAAIRDPIAVGKPSTVDDALGGGAVYLFGPNMAGAYLYTGRVRGPAFTNVAFNEAVATGSLRVAVPPSSAYTGTYVFAAALVNRATGQFVRLDLPVENSNAFEVR